jgi:hypothetical protein
MASKSKKKKTGEMRSLRKIKSGLKDQELFHGAKLVPTQPNEKKISSVVFDFVRPYSAGLRSENEWRKPLALALVAWNASLFPSAIREEVLDEFIHDGLGCEKEDLKTVIREMIDRKTKRFGGYDQVIADLDLNMTSKGPEVTVAYFKHDITVKRDRLLRGQF